MLLIGGLLFAGYQTAQAELRPAQAAQTFCDDLQAQNYTAAYALLSSGYQSSVTRDQFIQSSTLQNKVDGKIKGCPTASGNVIDLSFSAPKDHVAFLVTILRNKSFSGHIALVQQGGVWKVDAIEQSLAGTNLGPLLVANTFCSAISKGDYAAAYATLSSRQQSLATEQQFAQQFGSAFGGAVKLSSCTMNYTTYAVQATAASVTTTLNLTIASQTTNVATTFTFRLENGQWKLDEFTPQTPAS